MQATPVKSQNLATEQVTFGIKQQSLETALKQLQQQTSFVYYYRRADIKTLSNLTLPYATRTVEETLNELLKNTFINFRQSGQSIFIEKANQTAYEVRGRIIDINQKPVEFATVSIKAATTVHTYQTLQTDTGGYFKLSVAQKGNYLITISSIGMDSLSVAVLLADVRLLQLPDIVLSANSIRLKEVNVTSKIPFIEQKIDRTVVNVGAMISTTGINALEVLERSPGVQVDGNGKITFKGKTGVMVMIDDKPTYLSGDNLANYLRSLSAAQLDQIELMSNPPAKYDAAGDAGVINIKTKHLKNAGFNGMVSASAGKGQYWRSNESLVLNYRQNKTYLFFNGSYNHQKDYRRLTVGRTYFDPAGNLRSTYGEQAVFNPVTKSPNFKLGMDYYLTPKTTVGVVLSGLFTSSQDNINVNSAIKNNIGKIDSTIIANNSSTGKFHNAGINLNYSHKFDSLGKTITADLDYVKYNANKNQSFFNSIYNSNNNLDAVEQINANLPANINIYAAKVDYTQPLKGKSKFEAGFKSSYVNTDNAANYFNVINNISTVDENNTNRFLYKENINAAYFNFNKEFKRVSIQAGLRVENTNVNGHQLGNAKNPDSTFTQRYTNLFPTTYISYKLDTTGHHQLNLSYGKRITRPYYQDLNPFVTIIDKYSYFIGNTLLKPQFSSNYQLTYNYKSIFSISLVYTHISGYQAEADFQRGNIFIAQTVNFGQSINKGVNAYFAISPVKWWDFNIYAELVNNSFKSNLYGTYLNTNRTYYYYNINNQFRLGKGWSADLAIFHISKSTTGQFVGNARGIVNAGFQKKILNDKGAIKLSLRDILRQNFSAGSITNIPGVAATYHNDNANRAISLGFSYSFGQSGKTPKKRDTGSSGSEQNRVRQ
ncbi:outer membrane beta-barrel family protein [Mucilaginibacter puniceus]